MPFTTEWTVEEFRRQVDFCTELFMLYEGLPELAKLKADAAEHIARGNRHVFFTLHGLDPVSYASFKDGVLVVRDSDFEDVLEPWSVARRLLPGLDLRLQRITMTKSGMNLYDNTSVLKVHFRHAYTSDNQPGHRRGAEQVCGILREFAGLELNWERIVGKMIYLVAERKNGKWTMQSAPPPEG